MVDDAVIILRIVLHICDWKSGQVASPHNSLHDNSQLNKKRKKANTAPTFCQNLQRKRIPLIHYRFREQCRNDTAIFETDVKMITNHKRGGGMEQIEREDNALH